MDKLTLAYVPRPDATPESELAAVVAAYAFILECHAKKKAAESSGQDDAVKEVHHDHAEASMPQ